MVWEAWTAVAASIHQRQRSAVASACPAATRRGRCPRSKERSVSRQATGAGRHLSAAAAGPAHNGRTRMNRRDFIYAASVGAASAAMSTEAVGQPSPETTPPAARAGAKLKTITLEEHFASPGFSAGPGRSFVEGRRKAGGAGAHLIDQLEDVGEGRIAAMDAA